MPRIAVAWPQPDYLASLERAGATPRVLDPAVDRVPDVLDAVDGVLLTGGADVDPAHYGADDRHATLKLDAARDDYEIALAREALAFPAGRVGTVVWAHGSTAARSFPLGAFAGLLDVPAGDAAETIGRALDGLARQQPRVLAVDDAHLLDEHSAIVLHRVVLRRLAPVLVTLRAGEPVPDTVTSLWKDEHLPRADLAPLDATETVALVAAVLGGPVDSASAHRLWSLTQGSPLFLRHLLAGEVAAGRFTVNVLAEDQVDLCNRFGSSRGEKFDGLDWMLSRWETPALHDVLMRVHAEVYDVHGAGDHDVVMGQVLDLEVPNHQRPHQRPMLFFRGQFGIETHPVLKAPELWGWGDHWG